MKSFDTYSTEREYIETLCKRYKIMKYHITNENKVNVGGSVNIKDMGLNSIEIPFGNIMGDFDCSGNNLTSLENLPDVVMGSLYVNHNYLTSLDGCTDQVKVNFVCSNNNLTNMFGGPNIVGGRYDLSSNIYLETIDGIATNAKHYNISGNTKLPKELMKYQRYATQIVHAQYRFSIWKEDMFVSENFQKLIKTLF
jgi:hypothetical protein